MHMLLRNLCINKHNFKSYIFIKKRELNLLNLTQRFSGECGTRSHADTPALNLTPSQLEG